MKEIKKATISKGCGVKRITQFWFRIFRANGAPLDMESCQILAEDTKLPSWAVNNK